MSAKPAQPELDAWSDEQLTESTQSETDDEDDQELPLPALRPTSPKSPHRSPSSTSVDASVIRTVSVAALLELADLSSIAPSLSAAAFDDDCLALVIVELNDDWKSGVKLLTDLLRKADLTDYLAQLLDALPRKTLSQPRSRAQSQSALDADIGRLCRDLGDEVAEVPAKDRHPVPTAAVRANESATHNEMLTVPTLRRDSGGVVKAPDKTPKGSSFRDRFKSDYKANFGQNAEQEEQTRIERLKELNAELCGLQQKLILTPKKERKEVKKEADYVEKKIEQWGNDWSGKIKFADDAAVYDRPANARCLQPLARGTAEVSECGATLSGQGTFNSAEDFAKWLAASGATALKAPDSPTKSSKKKELREKEEENTESPKSYTDQALAGGKTFASPEEFAEWMRMTKLSDTGKDTPPAAPSETQESHEVVAPSSGTQHGNALSPIDEDQDAQQPTFTRLAPPPPAAVQSHFNPLTPRLMAPDPQLAQQRCAAPQKSAPRPPPPPPTAAWSPSPPLAPSSPASTNIGFNALCTPRMGAETSRRMEEDQV